MFGSFRQAMTWLHTWFGLVLGFVLVVVFLFGALYRPGWLAWLAGLACVARDEA